MTTIAESIEISRRTDDVCSYATDFSHFPKLARRRRVGAPRA
jgi:hypothetical protein